LHLYYYAGNTNKNTKNKTLRISAFIKMYTIKMRNFFSQFDSSRLADGVGFSSGFQSISEPSWLQINQWQNKQEQAPPNHVAWRRRKDLYMSAWFCSFVDVGSAAKCIKVRSLVCFRSLVPEILFMQGTNEIYYCNLEVKMPSIEHEYYWP